MRDVRGNQRFSTRTYIDDLSRSIKVHHGIKILLRHPIGSNAVIGAVMACVGNRARQRAKGPLVRFGRKS